ncbi:cysteine hydrolase family protein [Ethanoligenens harbinense]|uniref:Isochorismatase hydrolase n=1 Tax=Ethanoligenens harbinense (strain DSM 18485 / JCM 12961 / CGMCC 1.5033 / YUAN-3) TaxID=663278 RepID=E6U466_ETHHY|nr:isochorismatase family cysteine hydrolase [Ethanoligenens harbinense]ADU26566.1 isochorismatase hydrolase [Ethanoligenens harbinense YUAN-3]AVQ95691.1 cysteine hydrolase [Ethanoligenens harbinense YUAN-3]AYF38354.1 cysteine hydrolase [Ethanoligenens harbinense]AYF41099.1 cysteine hydrolase [Ethanoligenens harbinense]QCN91930.1 cysteine hydrolase [Ethanoligenens harbinense]
MANYALILVDMLNDFVTGALGCDRGRVIVPDLIKLTNAAREHGIPVIYSNDSHLKGIDHELKLWGDHAIRGTKGAEVIPELTPQETDYVIPKRRYSGFYQTDMQLLLSELHVDSVIITGLHTHMCCRHTSADAYYLGYNIVVPKETTNSFTEEDYDYGLKYLKEVYGANICALDDLIKSFD